MGGERGGGHHDSAHERAAIADAGAAATWLGVGKAGAARTGVGGAALPLGLDRGVTTVERVLLLLLLGEARSALVPSEEGRVLANTTNHHVLGVPDTSTDEVHTDTVWRVASE